MDGNHPPLPVKPAVVRAWIASRRAEDRRLQLRLCYDVLDRGDRAVAAGFGRTRPQKTCSQVQKPLAKIVVVCPAE